MFWEKFPRRGVNSCQYRKVPEKFRKSNEIATRLKQACKVVKRLSKSYQEVVNIEKFLKSF